MTYQPNSGAFSKTMSASVLIVDDLEANRMLLERRLEKLGYQVTSADSGASALSILEKMTPDIILLDYMMPQMNGLEVLERLRKNASTRNLPVIMVTARAEAEAVVDSLDSGADDYVTKPIDFDVLRARMETHIEKRKAASNLTRANAVLDQRVTLRSMALADMESELQDEIKKRQELEEKLAGQNGPAETGGTPTFDVQDLLRALNSAEQKLEELFSTAISGKPCNPAQLIQIKGEIASAKRQIAGK